VRINAGGRGNPRAERFVIEGEAIVGTLSPADRF
jgi:hypothetical protein